MVRRIEEEGWTATAVAAAFAVSERTMRKWPARYRAEGPAGLQDRSSRAHTVANRLAAAWVGMVLRLRHDYRLTAAEIAARAAAGALDRGGASGRRRSRPPEPARARRTSPALSAATARRAPPSRHQECWRASGKTWHRITGNRRNASGGPAGSSSTSPSMTPRAWPMSRSWPMSAARAAPASSSVPCAGSSSAASASSGG